MKPTAAAFPEASQKALEDPGLQKALKRLKSGFRVKRQVALEALPEFEELRDQARRVKDHVLANLDGYLEVFEANVIKAGGQVHWARDDKEACKLISEICRQEQASKILKGKSMISEEIGLNQALEADGFEVVETDLGEYIIQLRNETPSHIIAPAIHVHKEQVADSFREHHQQLPPERDLGEPRQLLDEARDILREHFLSADVGITGANMLIAETGTSVIVTNEGNGDLTQTLPRVHIVVASLEKLVPTWDDAATIIRLLARSATGQEISTYTTFSTGPRRAEDPDGPEAYHVVLLDNGRTNVLGTEFEEMLRCIRCGACMNHCPVYGAVGGHAYGWVYPGPIGSVLTPNIIGMEEAHHLPNASSLCGKCEEVCPVGIPLPGLLRKWREYEYHRKLSPKSLRNGIGLWTFIAARPRLYRFFTSLGARFLKMLGGKKGHLNKLPFAGGWTSVRDLPTPEGRTFMNQWRDDS